MMSLRTRVTLVTAAVVLALLGGGSWILGRSITAALDREFDLLTTQRLSAAATGIEFEHGGIEIHGQGPAVTGLAAYTPAGQLAVGDAWMRPPPGLELGAQPILGTAVSPAGQACRTAWLRLQPESDNRPEGSPPLDVGIAMTLRYLQEQQRAIVGTLLAGAILVAIATIVVLGFALRRMLAPHAQLAEDVGSLDPRRPDRRLAVAGMPPELRGIAERINELCDRLERAYGLASTVHAAAAHELRTPIAGLRATIEVAMQPGGKTTEALATCHGIALQMQARIDNLLMAARIDAGQLVPRREEVDVHALLRACWEPVADRVATRGLATAWDLGGSGLAVADPEALRMVLANLFDNLASHALGSQPVRIATEDAGGRIRVVIANPAMGMAAATADQVFVLGWRAAGSSSDQRHAGLGMAISRELVGLMAGRIEARLEDGMFVVALTLPGPGVFEYW